MTDRSLEALPAGPDLSSGEQAVSAGIAETDAALSPVLLDTVLRPHRSLPPRGFVLLMSTLAGVSCVAGVTCVLLGAWPVCGFFGADVLLVWLAFRLNYRAARRHEALRLTREVFTVDQVGVRGDRRQSQFQPYWLRVTVEDPGEPQGRLVLRSHGRSLVIGSFLGAGERDQVAASLKDALRRWRDLGRDAG